MWGAKITGAAANRYSSMSCSEPDVSSSSRFSFSEQMNDVSCFKATPATTIEKQVSKNINYKHLSEFKH